jgi:hypothetical protein
MRVLICLLYLTLVSFAQPYEPTLLYDWISEPDGPFGVTVLSPIGDQDNDGFDDILMSVWEGVGTYYNLRIVYGGAAEPYRTVDFGHISPDTSTLENTWIQMDFSGCGDYNGDGYTDILADLWGGAIEGIELFLWLGGGVPFDTILDWRSGSLERLQLHGQIGDYDANGLDDFIRSYGSSDNRTFRFYSGSYPDMPSNPTWEYGPGVTHYATNPNGFGDINGDGWSDFTYDYGVYRDLELDSLYTQFWLGGPDADSLPDITLAYDMPDHHVPGTWRIVGDMNGDSIADLLTTNFSNPEAPFPEIYYGGAPLDFETPDAYFNNPDWYFSDTWFANLGDINGDGCEDIGFRDSDYPMGGGYIHVFLGGNPPDPTVDFSIVPYYDGVYTPGFKLASAGDFNGDGIDDWMFASYDQPSLGGQGRSRVTIIAGDERFGQSVPQGPPAVAEDFKLGAPYPNPFNSEVTIPLEIARGPKLVDIRIYNVLGQEVRVFGNVLYTAGQHRIVWDGRSNTGESVTSGQYFVQATVGQQMATAVVRLVK